MSCKHGEWHQCDLCDEVDAAFKSGYEEGGKLSIDLTMKHLQRAEKAEQANRRMVELLKEPSDGFKQWFLSQIPSGTVISNPEWWIPRIHKAMSAELMKEAGE